MKLYIDMGNSRIKLLAVDGYIADGVLTVNQYGDDDWLGGIDKTPATVIALNVNTDNRSAELEQRCRERWSLPVQWVRTSAAAAGLHNAYPTPEHLGVDRWAAMTGAFTLFPGDLIVADFGTASTFDAVNADGRHLGGWIAPGIDAMHGLQRQRLPHLFREGAPAGRPVKLADSTVDALESGVLQVQAGALQRFARLAEQAGLRQPVWALTGGHGHTIAGLIERPVQLEPLLVFYGMRQLAGSAAE